MVSVPANTAARQSDATGTSRDSPPERHGQRRQRVCRGFQGAFSFWGEAAGACSRCCWAAAPAPVRWRIELGKQQPGGPPQPGHSRGQPPAHGPGGRRGPAQKTSPGLPAAPEEVGAAADTEHRGSRHHDHRRQGCQGRRTATTVGAPAPVAAPAAPTHENKSGGQLPATSPTASAISFLPTVQQRGRVGHLQSPRHRTISWNGVYQEESPISHFGGPEAGQCTITPFSCA
jgi:hypothetical protein